MERSAVYRRALAPVMTYCGLIGIVAGGLGWKLNIDSTRGFVWFWSTVAATLVLLALLLVRRQALKEAEPFWSPPTKRVAQALLPPFVIGLFVGISSAAGLGAASAEIPFLLIIIWSWLYGCALHAAGFFISRGIRILGWVYGLTGCMLLLLLLRGRMDYFSPNFLMSAVFGGLHLACGIYLYFTEKHGNES